MEIEIDKVVNATVTIRLNLAELRNLLHYLEAQPKKLRCGLKHIGQEEADKLEFALGKAAVR